MDNVKEPVTVILLVGVIGAGKTTFAQKEAARNPLSVIVSGDAFRGMLKPAYIYRKDIEQIVNNLTETAVLSAIQHGLNPIIDEADGYITKEKRKKLIELIRSFFPDKNEVSIMAVEFDRGLWCLERRLKDDRGLSKETWERVYNEMMRDFEDVSYTEGFNATYFENTRPVEYIKNKLDTIALQRIYCKNFKLPFVMPIHGSCFRCKTDIRFHPATMRSASSSHIITCPACGMAWGD